MVEDTSAVAPCQMDRARTSPFKDQLYRIPELSRARALKGLLLGGAGESSVASNGPTSFKLGPN